MTFGVAFDALLRSECGFAVNSFIGRSGEIRELKQRLGAARLVTVTGPGGVGKSRLAHRAAVTLRRAYPDRLHCVDLTEVHDARLLTHDLQDPQVLAHLVANAIGVGQDGAATATAALIAHFAPRPGLLLLDNCESRLPACAVLVQTLLRACPQLRILATSREPLLLDAEATLPIRPLAVPPQQPHLSVAELRQNESVALFLSRAASTSDFELTDGNAAATAELCRRLDGLPLAIELAAARIRTLGPAQMLQRTDDRFSLLSCGSRHAPARQRSLRACVDWSFELCSKPEQRLWARLSVFAGPFELDAVEGVCTDESVPAADLLDLMSGLVNKSVLISEGSGDRWRYRMLETFRDHGRRRLIEADGHDELHRRHRAWYADLVRRSAAQPIDAQQASRLRRLGQELPNLRIALADASADPGGAHTALQMVAGLWPLWAAHGHHDEARRRLDQVLARPAIPTPHHLEAWYGASVLAAACGDLAAVRSNVAQVRTTAVQLADHRARVVATCAEAVLALADGRPAVAARAWRAATDAVDNGCSLLWRARSHAGLGVTTALLGDIDTAHRCAEEVLAMCPPDGGDLLAGPLLGRVGVALWQRGDSEQAVRWLRDGLRRLQRVDDRFGIAMCLRALAGIADDDRRAEQAATLLGAADGVAAVDGPGLAEAVRGAAGRPAHAADEPATVLAPLPPKHQVALSRARAVLGTRGFRAAYARGAAMSFAEAVAYGRQEHDRRAPDAPPAGPNRLTRRELQVAELVAQGKTNKDIAAALVISRRTAESHVENILTKLDLANRGQLAVWMVRS
ncbi:MAG TPA: LuxR C-terminal-related transcriptional regulator, partial [Actinoplanes sp.]|nr:LuxR C-terminal-related transcriptional regulator [Actinoplanes sp.]